MERRDVGTPSDADTATAANAGAPSGFSENDTVDVRLEDVSLRFGADGEYVYTSTLDYYEDGTFALDGDLLTTIPRVDTIGRQRMRITALQGDSLKLLMDDQGRRRELGFRRVD